MSAKLNNIRNAAKSVIIGVVLPKVADRLMDEMSYENGDDFKLLGMVVARFQKNIQQSIDNINYEHEIDTLNNIFREDLLESQIRAAYLFERLKKLKPAMDNIISQIKTLEKALEQSARLFQTGNGNENDLIKDIKKRFNIE